MCHSDTPEFRMFHHEPSEYHLCPREMLMCHSDTPGYKMFHHDTSAYYLCPKETLTCHCDTPEIRCFNMTHLHITCVPGKH